MAAASHRNLHVPLPDETYRALRSEADRRRRAATALVREAVEDWLARRRAETLHAARGRQRLRRSLAGGFLDGLPGQLVRIAWPWLSYSGRHELILAHGKSSCSQTC